MRSRYKIIENYKNRPTGITPTSKPNKGVKLPILVENLANKIATDLGMTLNDVHKIIDSEFKFLKRKISNYNMKNIDTPEDLDSIRLIYLGMWYPNEKRFKRNKAILERNVQPKK